jgi:hypothetical protein
MYLSGLPERSIPSNSNFLIFFKLNKKNYIIRKLFVLLRYIYLFILTTFYVYKNIITKFEIIAKKANSASKRAGRTSRWFVSARLAWETWTRLHPSCVGPPVNIAARPDRGALTRTLFAPPAHDACVTELSAYEFNAFWPVHGLQTWPYSHFHGRIVYTTRTPL